MSRCVSPAAFEKPRHVLPALTHQLRAGDRQLLIPRIQRRHQRGLNRRRAEQLVALLQCAIVALHRIVVRRPELRQRHIHKAPPLRRAVLDRAQILRRKQHARHMPHQFARARRLLSGHEDVPPPRERQADLHLMAAVPALRADLHIGHLRAPAHQIAILPRPVRPAGAGQIDRLEQVRLSLPVVAQQHRHALAGRERAACVIPVIPEA